MQTGNLRVRVNLDCKEIQPVHPKGDQSWVFIGGTDAEAETPVLWPPPAKSWPIGKDPDAGRDWGQEKGTTEDEMVGWHHRLDGHVFEWTTGVCDGQGSLACCDSWGHKESDTTERLNWTEDGIIGSSHFGIHIVARAALCLCSTLQPLTLAGVNLNLQVKRFRDKKGIYKWKNQMGTSLVSSD